jgi:unsaturated chondroitin disaccharide hydrolase
MKSLVAGLVVACCALPWSARGADGGDPSLRKAVDHALDVGRTQSLAMAASLRDRPGLLPRTLDKNGALVTCAPEWWTSGFFPGVLWYLYEETRDTAIAALAREFSARVESQKYVTGHHDVGFMIFCSFGNGYRLTRDPAYREVIRTAATSLSTRFDPVIGAIRSWGPSASTSKWQYAVIIDNMMNLEILEWTAKEFGIGAFDRIARAHANTTMRNHFREDLSTFHVVSYDTVTGLPEKKQTAQGFSDASMWARGQAWGLYGFTMMYRETGNPDYLHRAEGMADRIINHPRFPADGIPYWDFDAPGIPQELRDASAGAIMCSALLELSRHSTPAKGAAYRKVAETQLRTLASPSYLAEKGTNGNFILRHGVGHKPAGSEVDVPLSYADYYFLEALLRYKRWQAPADASPRH